MESALTGARSCGLHTALSSLGVGVMVFDKFGGILQTNEFAEQFVDLEFFQADRLRYQVEETLLVRALHGEVVCNEEVCFPGPGKQMWLSANLTPVFDGQKNLVSVVCVFTDITDRKLAEQAMQTNQKRAENELEISNLLLKAANTIALSVNLQNALDLLADIILEVSNRSRMAVFLYEKKTENLTLVLSRGESRFQEQFNLLSCAPSIQHAILAGETMIVDYDSDETSALGKQRARVSNCRLSLIVPLVVDQNVIGYVGIDEPGSRKEFSNREIALVEGVAAQAAIAIMKTRLFAKTEQLYKAERDKARELMEHRANLELMIKQRTQEISSINEKLRNSEAQHRQIIEVSPDAYLVYVRNQIKYANPAALGLLGFESIDEMRFDSFQDLIRPKDAYGFKELIALAESKQIPVHLGEITVIPKGNRPSRIVEATIIPVNFEGEKARQYIVRDITRRKELERELARLDRLNLIGEMAAGFGHEVRNPMTSVRGFLQLMANKETDPKKLEYYDVMLEELDRANSIISEFLSLARDRAVKLKRASLNSIIDSLYPLLCSDALAQDKLIVLDKNEIPDILLNEKEIRQLIVNLVRNGLEAMPAGKSVTIGTFLRNDEIVLRVADQGTGIKPEILDKLGTPFVTSKDFGTGLGLSVCYSVVHKHNARIDVETGVTGTTFMVRFKAPKSAGIEKNV